MSGIKNAAQTVQTKRRKPRGRQIPSDKFIGWLDCYATGSKSAEDATEALQHFVGPAEKVNLFYTDDAPELNAAAKHLKWRHDTSTPGRPQNNGVAERVVRTVLEGARAILHASGLPSRWWSRAIRYFCFMHNVTEGRGGATHAVGINIW